jgi:hypothetical protein
VNAARLRALGAAGAVAAVLFIAAGLFLACWNEPTPQAMPDTYMYTRQAVIYSGAGTAHADEVASRLVCSARNRYARQLGLRQACHHYPAHEPDPRYLRIFTTRPGFPLLATPLVGLAGAWRGMEWATALAAALAAVLGYAAVRALGGSRIAGLASAVLLFILPAGYWITRMLPEGAMLAGCLATGAGITLLRPRRADGGSATAPGRGRITAGITLAAAGLLWTYVIKSANGFLLSSVLLAGGAGLTGWTWVRPRTAAWWRTSGVVMAMLGLVGTVGWVVVSKLAHLPSFSDTIQDMATRHFRGRPTPNPLGYLLSRDAWFIPHWFLVLVNDRWALPVVAAGIAALVWICRSWAVPWLLIGVTGPLAMAAHPLGSEADRLVLPVWLPVIAGLALGADRAGRWAIRRWVTGHGTAAERPDGQSVARRSPSRPAADSVPSPPARS